MTEGLLLKASAVVVMVTIAAHSIFGERRLIAPILALDTPITNKPLARAVLRFAWHFTSALGLVLAVMLWRSGDYAGADSIVLITAGGVLLASGLIDAVWSKFRHMGWPMLTLAGALILMSQFQF